MDFVATDLAPTQTARAWGAGSCAGLPPSSQEIGDTTRGEFSTCPGEAELRITFSLDGACMELNTSRSLDIAKIKRGEAALF